MKVNNVKPTGRKTKNALLINSEQIIYVQSIYNDMRQNFVKTFETPEVLTYSK